MTEFAPTEMMKERRRALNELRGKDEPVGGPWSVRRLDVPADHWSTPMAARDLAGVIELALRRPPQGAGAGVVVARLLGATLEQCYAIQSEVFDRWLQSDGWLARQYGDVVCSDVTIKDGQVDEAAFGSNWSYKSMHIDADSLVFSHVYGPVIGFDGGEMYFADALAYMRDNNVSFDEMFDWSIEVTPGSKPVVRAEHSEALMGQYGENCGVVGSDCMIFIDNCSNAGVVHGVSPLRNIDDRFNRAYRRLSVKRR